MWRKAKLSKIKNSELHIILRSPEVDQWWEGDTKPEKKTRNPLRWSIRQVTPHESMDYSLCFSWGWAHEQSCTREEKRREACRCRACSDAAAAAAAAPFFFLFLPSIRFHHCRERERERGVRPRRWSDLVVSSVPYTSISSFIPTQLFPDRFFDRSSPINFGIERLVWLIGENNVVVAYILSPSSKYSLSDP